MEPAQPWSARCNPRVQDGFVGVSASSWPELPSPHYSSCKHVPGGPNESPRGGQRGEATSSPCPFMLTDLSLSVCTGSSVQEGRAKPPRSNVGTSWSCDAKTNYPTRWRGLFSPSAGYLWWVGNSDYLQAQPGCFLARTSHLGPGVESPRSRLSAPYPLCLRGFHLVLQHCCFFY